MVVDGDYLFLGGGGGQQQRRENPPENCNLPDVKLPETGGIFYFSIIASSHLRYYFCEKPLTNSESLVYYSTNKLENKTIN